MEATWWTQPEQLDDDQKGVVSLTLGGNHLIVGPPGSGKTNLLILRATFLYRNKTPDTIVLTFGRVLREFLAAGADNYPFSSEKIQTYVKWAGSILRENGIAFEEHGEFEVVRASLLAGLQELSERGDIEHIYDCILIDEAQDYSADEIRLIQRFAKSVFAVGDDRQRIFQENGALEALKAICQVSILSYHYRNGIKICRTADGISDKVDKEDGLEANSQYDETEYPSSVRSIGGLTIPGQVEVTVAEIETQLRAYPDGIIGVLCPRHQELVEVCSLLERSSVAQHVQVQRYPEGYAAFDADKRVIVTTLHSAKGLEFRALHMLGMDKVSKFRGAQKRMSYTGVTRAKTSLAIYHEGNLPGYLERGLAAVEPDDAPPSLNDLFL